MGKIKEVVSNLKIGCQPKGKSNLFDTEESQKIYEQRNNELHELGQIFKSRPAQFLLEASTRMTDLL